MAFIRLTFWHFRLPFITLCALSIVIVIIYQKLSQFHKSKMNESTILNDRIVLEAYPLIKSAHPCWPVIIYAIFVTILTISGILLNFAVILVTFWTKSFRGSVNILLAFYSLCEIVNLSGNFLSIFTAFSGQYFMPFKSAVYFVIAPIICFGCAMNLMLFIGIERLFTVLFPLKKFNHTMFAAITLLYNLIFIILTSAIICTKFSDEKFGAIEIFANYYEIGPIIGKCFFLVLFGLISITITVIVYLLIAVALLCRTVPSNGNSAHFNNRIFRSLFTIISINFGGYLSWFFLFFLILPFIQDNPIALWHTNKISGILVHISASSNGPILYLTSSEYREAFQKTFAFLFEAFCKSSAIVPQN